MSCLPRDDPELALLAGYCSSHFSITINQGRLHVEIGGKSLVHLTYLASIIDRVVPLTDSGSPLSPQWREARGSGRLQIANRRAREFLEVIRPYLTHCPIAEDIDRYLTWRPKKKKPPPIRRRQPRPDELPPTEELARLFEGQSQPESVLPWDE